MPKPDFVHLHVHSEYSLLDGANKIPALVKRCAELEMPALGLTDHGVLSGSIEFYKECKKAGISPVLGLEAYLVDSRHKREAKFEQNHLTLLALDATGYKNLVEVSSAGFLEGFRKGRPNVDLDLLGQHCQGVVALTGCLQSRFARRLVEGRADEARHHLDDLIQIFGKGSVYIEVQENRIEEQGRVNEGAYKIAAESGVPLVATADVHYLRKEDYQSHAALLCVQTKSTLEEPQVTFDTNEFYLKSREQMYGDFKQHPEALAATVEIAERADLEIKLGELLLPTYPCPEGYEANAYLRKLAFKGLQGRYGEPVPAQALERVEYELGVIERMGFESYFLMVWDFVKYAKDSKIAVGPGRGSAAGSLVSYALRITDVDPLKHDLLFERFLNPARKSMPDIDIDFSTHGRDQVIKYVASKYGQSSVAQIITFGKMAPKAATRDAGRVLGYSYSEVDRIAKLVPDPLMGRNPTFEECLKPSEPLRAAYDSDDKARKIVDVARGLEGIVRNNSIHAAAVVIADRPLTEIVPLQLAEDRDTKTEKGERSYRTVTQYSMGPIEEIGLLKMDFLGLRNLDVLESAVDIIERSKGIKIDIHGIPLDDLATYEMLSRGDSIGVFQFESEGMRESLKQVRPTEFEDLVALVALYRPGPMKFIPDYARGKHNPASVRLVDERLTEITGPTYGIAIFQEQLMEIAQKVAAFSGPESDDLRKAIGKKKRKLMASMEQKFLQGCAKSGTLPRVASQLWLLMEAAADYSFNKSHAACYALIAYRTAYLKANYPAEYMAAVISSVMQTKDKVPFFVLRCEEMGIRVLPPDVNSSSHDFVVVDGDIRFGLDAVKNVGYGAVERIIAARSQDGPFDSIWGFCAQVDSSAVNRRAIESLIKCGAFDTTGASRKGMLEVLEAAVKAGQQAQADALSGQTSLLGGDSAGPRAHHHPPLASGEFERAELLHMEKEAVGLFLSSHPLAEIGPWLAGRVDCPLAQLESRADGSWVTVAGLVAEVKQHRTKKGEPMLFARLDDLDGSVEMLVFNSKYASGEARLQLDQAVIVKGKVDHKEIGETKLVVQEVEPIDPAVEMAVARTGANGSSTKVLPSATHGNGSKPNGNAAAALKLSVPAERLGPGTIEDLKSAFENFPGEAEVVLEVESAQGKRLFRFGASYRVSPSSSLSAEVGSILGPTVHMA